MDNFATRHPNLVTWAVLAAGMVVALFWSARGVDDLTAGRYFWLALFTVLLAGLCAWIISWEADDSAAAGDRAEAEDTDDTIASAG